MKLLLPFDHRFFRSPSGEIFSDKAFTYGFFKSRYLKVFEKVSILARVQDMCQACSPGKAIEGPGVEIIALPNWLGSMGFIRSRSAIIKLALSAIKQPSAVILLGPGGIGSMLQRPLNRLRYPIALEVIGDPWDAFQPGAIKHPLRPLLRRYLSQGLRAQCASACAVSYVTTEFLQSRYPCPNFSIGVSDVVLPGSSLAIAPRTYSPSKKRSIVNVAVMNGYKGHDVLVDALEICKSHGDEIELVLVGDGRFRADVEERAVSKNVRNLIRFAGQLPAGGSVQRELDSADLFVLPSLQEGAPRALIEAMARALPCVASDVGGIPEMLDADCLVPARDAQSLANKLREVLADTQRLTEMSRRNLLKAREYEDTVLSAKRIQFYEHVKATTETFLSR